MVGFVLRLLAGAFGFWLAAAIIPSVRYESLGTLVLAAALLGIVNAVIRPVLVLLTLPVTLLTLGLFLLVINAGMFALVAYLLPGFEIGGLGTAVVGAIIVSIGTWAASQFIQD